MSNKKIRKLPLFITAFIMVFIFIQSALPAEGLSFVIRKCAHFTEYMILGMSLFVTVREFIPDEERVAAVQIVSWSIGALYAVTDESHQSFVPGRSCEIRDILIDSCGVAAGVLIMNAIRGVRSGQKGVI